MKDFRSQEFQFRAHRLLEILLQDHDWRAHEPVNRHLRHGLLQRLGMIQQAIRVLADLPPDGSRSLNLVEVQNANLVLNGLFLNLRGALDNAAWALVHHYELQPEPDEASLTHRRFANLFGKEFLRALGERDPELAEVLQKHRDWGRDLAAFRDPAAHRVPLYIPPNVLDEEGAIRAARLDQGIEELAQRGELDSLSEYMMNRWQYGTFRAIVVLSEQEGLVPVSLPGVLNRDLGGLMDTLEPVSCFVFAPDARPVSRVCGPLPRRQSGGSAGVAGGIESQTRS